MTTTTDPAAPFRDALANILPAGLAWSVQVNARRKRFAVWIEPGGAVVVAVPPSADPARVAHTIQAERGRLLVAAAEKRERGLRIVRKQLVNGEGFPFAGRNHRLSLVVDGDDSPTRTPAGALTRDAGVPIAAEPGPSTWSGIRTWQLTMRRDAASARTVIEWYRAQGRAWLDQHMPDMLRRLHVPADAWPTWEVRPYRPSKGYGGTWGTYRNPPHKIFIDWFAFQFPADLLRYVAAHEAAHAALRGQYAHGREWETVVSRLCPDWCELDPRAKALPGLCLWVGDLDPAGEDDARPAPAPAPVKPAAQTTPKAPADPFVSGWAAVPAPSHS